MTEVLLSAIGPLRMKRQDKVVKAGNGSLRELKEGTNRRERYTGEGGIWAGLHLDIQTGAGSSHFNRRKQHEPTQEAYGKQNNGFT